MLVLFIESGLCASEHAAEHTESEASCGEVHGHHEHESDCENESDPKPCPKGCHVENHAHEQLFVSQSANPLKTLVLSPAACFPWQINLPQESVREFVANASESPPPPIVERIAVLLI